MHIDPFTIKHNGVLLNYRDALSLSLKPLETFFTSHGYLVKSIRQESRHVIALLDQGGKEYISKICSTDGIRVVTEQEYAWNDAYNLVNTDMRFVVPKNKECGTTSDGYFYIITDFFEGVPIAQFLYKLHSWFEGIPENIRKPHNIALLQDIAKSGARILKEKPRHGDFTPWHIFALPNGSLGLIDGEHASQHGVEHYDVCYLIQRVFSVLQDADTAKKLFSMALDRGCQREKMRVVLAARAIGGYLDSSLANESYAAADRMRDWVLSL